MIQALDVGHIYDVPMAYHQEGLDSEVLAAFGIDPAPKPRMEAWQDVSRRIHNPEGEVTIAVVGKYTGLKDAYKSLIEALSHGGLANNVKVKLDWIESEIFEQEDPAPFLEKVHGILVPGGFGDRGTRGMMRAAQIARERAVPYFGICYGFQWAAVEYARNVCDLTGADSTEVSPDTSHKVIYKLRDLLGVDELGGTMRLGQYACALAPGSLAQRLYNESVIHERHRHRYEFNCLYEKALTDRGLQITGRSLDGKFVEIVELPDHPWYVAVQFHPEFKSKPLRPHPLFAGFVEASHQRKRAARQQAPASVIG